MTQLNPDGAGDGPAEVEPLRRRVRAPESADPPLDAENRVVREARGFSDLTEWKRAEEARRRESLSALAGGVAHDFNNLLTAVIGYASLARQEAAAGSAGRDFLDRAIESARKAADLAGKMLAYSGRGRFLVASLDLSRLLRDLEPVLRQSVSPTAALTAAPADGLPPVSADAAQLRQVVLSLVANASEALGAQGGAIVVRTGVEWCDRATLRSDGPEDDLPEGEYVFLEVADAGCGMDADTRRRAFEPFFTTKFTGRGLGLAAAQGVVRGHRGAIRLTSEPGHGTTVRVWLPAAPPRPDAPSAAGSVLFVDDEPALRDLAVRTLRPAGYEVLTAADGRQALEALRAAPGVRVVVLDLTMPGPEADETLRELRRLRSDVRIILSSGHGEQEVSQRFAFARTGFLQKPYRPYQLIEKVREALA